MSNFELMTKNQLSVYKQQLKSKITKLNKKNIRKEAVSEIR